MVVIETGGQLIEEADRQGPIRITRLHAEALLEAVDQDWVVLIEDPIEISLQPLDVASLPPSVSRYFVLQWLKDSETGVGYDNLEESVTGSVLSEQEFWERIAPMTTDGMLKACRVDAGSIEYYGVVAALTMDGDESPFCYILFKNFESEMRHKWQEAAYAAVILDSKGEVVDYYETTSSNGTTHCWEEYSMPDVA